MITLILEGENIMHQIVVHYGELSTKGRNRKSFQNKLAENIREQTQHLERLKIKPNHDFMHLSWESTPIESIIEILKTIPGISRFEPVHRVEKELEAIKAKAIELFTNLNCKAGESFRVVVKRSDKSFEYDTMSLQREVGFEVGAKFPELVVDLRHAQHIDGLHQAAGSTQVIELHGSVWRNYCTQCGKYYDLNQLTIDEEGIPRCEKDGAIVKPDVVLYEEGLNSNDLDHAIEAISNADLLIIAGTSLIVYPAAGLVNYFKGKKMVVVNKTAVPLYQSNVLTLETEMNSVFEKIM